jgi:O-succinylbenzoate synthase
MRLQVVRVELRYLKLPLRFRFETSFGAVTEKSFLLAQVFTADGAWGVGECVAEDDPYYLPETNGTVRHVIADFLAPLVLGHTFESPSDTDVRLSRVRGNEMAKAALEMAIWDMFARARGEPLSVTLGGDGRAQISAGVSIGLQEDVATLLKRVETEVAAGYQRIKIKIKPGRDLELVHAIRTAFPAIRLMVDANSAYTLADADHLRGFDAFNLMMVEQPLGWNDIVEHSKLQAQIATPICLDESITSPAAAESAISIGACGIINIKAGRVGGLLNSKRIQEAAARQRIPVWCGGMLESGIGRLANVHLQTLPGFTLPGDTSASARYFEEDLIEPGVVVDGLGRIGVPDGPGLGHEIVWSRVERATRHRDIWAK